MLEITKTGLAPVRVFDVVKNGSITETRNPEVGTYWAATERDAYLLTTGRAFSHPGTCNPLHVHIVEGGMPIEKLLEDVYSLSCLAWTRPEDCSRVPATIKLADIRLTENAGGYDEDDIEFTDEEDINE
jgi:argonaute-like protein implicated in RNA metabolism and viral defense